MSSGTPVISDACSQPSAAAYAAVAAAIAVPSNGIGFKNIVIFFKIPAPFEAALPGALPLAFPVLVLLVFLGLSGSLGAGVPGVGIPTGPDGTLPVVGFPVPPLDFLSLP